MSVDWYNTCSFHTNQNNCYSIQCTTKTVHTPWPISIHRNSCSRQDLEVFPEVLDLLSGVVSEVSWTGIFSTWFCWMMSHMSGANGISDACSSMRLAMVAATSLLTRSQSLVGIIVFKWKQCCHRQAIWRRNRKMHSSRTCSWAGSSSSTSGIDWMISLICMTQVSCKISRINTGSYVTIWENHNQWLVTSNNWDGDFNTKYSEWSVS